MSSPRAGALPATPAGPPTSVMTQKNAAVAAPTITTAWSTSVFTEATIPPASE